MLESLEAPGTCPCSGAYAWGSHFCHCFASLGTRRARRMFGALFAVWHLHAPLWDTDLAAKSTPATRAERLHCTEVLGNHAGSAGIWDHHQDRGGWFQYHGGWCLQTLDVSSHGLLPTGVCAGYWQLCLSCTHSCTVRKAVCASFHCLGAPHIGHTPHGPTLCC